MASGERNRVHLAKMLRCDGNVLLLDEPTSTFNVHTLRALEDALEASAGCAVVISHDRWFLDRICIHVLAFEGNSQVRVVRGQLHRVRGLAAAEGVGFRRQGSSHQVQAACA